MAVATILTIGPGPLIEPLAESLADGAELHSTEVAVHHLDAVGPTLPADLLDDLARSVGVAIGSSLSPGDTGKHLSGLYRLAHTAIDGAPQVPFRVATTFTSLPKDDPAAGEAVDAMNRLLYRWGAVIVSPGYADEPAVHWLDSRPGAGTRSGEKSVPDRASLEAAQYQGRRLASLVAMIAASISRLERLQL